MIVCADFVALIADLVSRRDFLWVLYFFPVAIVPTAAALNGNFYLLPQ